MDINRILTTGLFGGFIFLVFSILIIFSGDVKTSSESDRGINNDNNLFDNLSGQLPILLLCFIIVVFIGIIGAAVISFYGFDNNRR